MTYVRFLKRINYRNGLVTPTTVMQLPEDEARAVIAEGWAVEVEVPAEPEPEPAPAKTATRQPAKSGRGAGRKRG